jgi:hypothetical protein
MTIVTCDSPILELANYHVLGRLFHYVPYAAPFNPSRVTSFFGGVMLAIEGLNGAGVALAANAGAGKTTQDIGRYMILIALGLQVIVIFSFVYLSVKFWRRCIDEQVVEHSSAISSVLVTLYMSMTLIFIRCVYRVVEYAIGSTNKDIDSLEALEKLSPLLRIEIYFLIFEASLMLLNSVVWNLRHPGLHLPSDMHIYLAQDGLEVRGEAKRQQNPILTFLNVMCFGLLIRQDDKRDSTASEIPLTSNPKGPTSDRPI